MPGKVLLVDDMLFNIKLLEAKLQNEYYDVVTAFNGADAVRLASEAMPDIILMDVMMPGMDGFEATRRIKENPETAHIPIIIVTALNDRPDKITGLQSGADDFLTKPINDFALMARIKSLIRMKVMMDELRLRLKTVNELGVDNKNLYDWSNTPKIVKDAKILIVNDDVIQIKNIKEALLTNGIVTEECTDPNEVNRFIDKGNYDAIIVSTQMIYYDGLRVFSQIRNNQNARHTPVVILIDENNQELFNRGLELGVNDYLTTPIDKNELIARIITQIKKKRYQDALQANYFDTISMSFTDSLTNLHNRRYFDAHIKNMMEIALKFSKSLSLMMIDIDYFKKVNDTYGHQAGDAVLKKVGELLQLSLRLTDMSVRYGGEEFVVAMPETDLEGAITAANRILEAVSGANFVVPGSNETIKCSCSVGLSCFQATDTIEDLLARADKALYQSKADGRNRLTIMERKSS